MSQGAGRQSIFQVADLSLGVWLNQEMGRVRLPCGGPEEPCGRGPGSPRGRCLLMSGTTWAVCGMSWPWFRVGEALCTCPICVLGSDLAAAEDGAGRDCRETPGLCFEQEPGLDSRIGNQPRHSPHWPLINENCRSASALPPPPPAAAEMGGASPGAVPRVPGSAISAVLAWQARLLPLPHALPAPRFRAPSTSA